MSTARGTADSPPSRRLQDLPRPHRGTRRRAVEDYRAAMSQRPSSGRAWRAGSRRQRLYIKLERAAWGNGNTMTFDSIHIKEGQARLIANVGAGDVRVLMTPTRLTFVGGDRPRQPQLHRRVRWLWPFPAAHRGPISAHEDSQRPVPVPVPQHLLHSRIARDAAAICYFLYACGIAAGLVLLVPWASAGKAGTS
jgi:hypothetical protein